MRFPWHGQVQTSVGGTPLFLLLIQCTKLGRCQGNSLINHFMDYLDINQQQQKVQLP